jgi:ABC-type phosphate/phosphonate transport system permease subunit
MSVGDRHIASSTVGEPSNKMLATPGLRRYGQRFRALRRNTLVLACQIAVLVVLLVSWELATAKSALNAFLFGSPSAVWGFLVEMWKNGSLFTDTKVTAMETLLGFVIGNVLGTLIGLALWYSRFVSQVVQPFIVALGSIPIIALAPICIIWFGTGLISKVAMATLSVVVVALITAYKGAMSVDVDQINLMRTLEAPHLPEIDRAGVPRRYFRWPAADGGLRADRRNHRRIHVFVARAGPRNLQGGQPIHYSQGIRCAGGDHRFGALSYVCCRQDRKDAHPLAATLIAQATRGSRDKEKNQCTDR